MTHGNALRAEVPSLSVILPNFNGRSLLTANLPTLHAALVRVGLQHEVLVVDDGSDDDSLAVLAGLSRSIPSLRVIAKDRNTGFSSTCNRGIEAAYGSLVCISNTDVRFPLDFFVAALPPLLDGSADIVTTAVLNFRDGVDAPTSINEPMRLVLRRGRVHKKRRLEGAGTVVHLLGCCFLSTTLALRRLGGFDERYDPFYWEDLELGLRATRAGLRQRHLREVELIHQESSTIGRLDPARARRVPKVRMRNRVLLSWALVEGPLAWTRQCAWESAYLLTRWLTPERSYYYAAVIDAFRRWLSPPRHARVDAHSGVSTPH